MITHFKKYKIYYVPLLVCGLVAYYFCLPKVLFQVPYCKVLYDVNGDLLGASISSDGQWRFPLIDTVPSKFEKCITTFEDQRFYYHPGFDPIGIVSAIKQNLKARAIVRGGSTITMQVMRLAGEGQDRTYFNKIKETIQATRLEWRLSKNEILIQYASHAPFGGNVVGLEAASWRYYSKSPHLLSWAESATMAVLPNAPALIHPGRNRTLLQNKRDRLLNQLLSKGIIDSVTYNLSLLEPIPENPRALPRLAPHLLHRSDLYNASNQLHSSIVPEVQTMALDVVDFHHNQYQQQGIKNMAVLVLDTYTGEVLAYVGNAPNSKHQQNVDMIMAQRSTGSLLKPILYASAIEEGLISPNLLLDDVPIYIDGFHPENYDRTYRGAVPADEALMQSLNVPYVLLLKDFGIGKFINTLQHHGLSTINKDVDYYGLSLIIGGAEGTMWEMCGAYATYGRILLDYQIKQSRYVEGLQLQPTVRSQLVKENSYKLSASPDLISASAVYHTLEALTNLKRPSEEGLWEQFSSARKIAWKTGTSYGHKDAWAIGVSPKYTIGVWVGNADGEGIAELVGVKKAAPVMFDLFNRLPTSEWFTPPYDDMSPSIICKASGMKASAFCSEIDTVYQGNSSLPYNCTFHKLVYLNEEETHCVNTTCYPLIKMVKKGWFTLPPKQAEYYKKVHPEFQQIPPYDIGCTFDEKPMVDIVYPPQNGEVIIPKNLNGQLEKIVFKAIHTKNEGKVFWYIDNEFVGVTIEFHNLGLSPSIGIHQLTISDENGFQVNRKFEVK